MTLTFLHLDTPASYSPAAAGILARVLMSNCAVHSSVSTFTQDVCCHFRLGHSIRKDLITVSVVLRKSELIFKNQSFFTNVFACFNK